MDPTRSIALSRTCLISMTCARRLRAHTVRRFPGCAHTVLRSVMVPRSTRFWEAGLTFDPQKTGEATLIRPPCSRLTQRWSGRGGT